MGDTIRGDFSEKVCSDCGEKGCDFKHWGPLVPNGEIAYLCSFCWHERNERYDKGEDPKPLGQKPPGIPEEFIGRPFLVTTKSGSVYRLTLTDQAGERIVSHNTQNLGFSRAKVVCLMIGKPLFLRSICSPSNLRWSTPVVSIDPLF